MNRKQLRSLWFGIMIAVMMGLYPPWTHQGPHPSSNDYGLIWDPPGYNLTMDFARLSIQWFLVALVTGELIVTFRGKGP